MSKFDDLKLELNLKPSKDIQDLYKRFISSASAAPSPLSSGAYVYGHVATKGGHVIPRSIRMAHPAEPWPYGTVLAVPGGGQWMSLGNGQSIQMFEPHETYPTDQLIDPVPVSDL